MPDPSSRLARIGIIGAGWWSTYTHLPAVLGHPGAQLVGLCDNDPQRLRAAADAYGLTCTYDRLETMLAEAALDGVVIATPHATHAALARACLEHGLHVMLEKPMTLTAVDARQLVELARAHGRELIIGYPWHFTPQPLAARALLLSGKLGPVQYINCSMVSSVARLLSGEDRGLSDPTVFPVHGPGAVYSNPALSGGGQGHLQLTHSIGLMSFVTGLRVERVLALMHNHGLAVDLVDALAVAFEGGALATVGGSGNSATHKLDLVIRCAHGGLDLSVDHQTLTVYYPDGRIETTGPLPAAAIEPRFATARNLVDVILGVAANGSPAEPAWRTVELLDAAYRSAARDGQAVWVKDLYPPEAEA
jgi:predicted dehydrogenase